VVYHPNMKAFGLQKLLVLFINWKQAQEDKKENDPNAES